MKLNIGISQLARIGLLASILLSAPVFAAPAAKVVPLLLRERTDAQGKVLPAGCFNDRLLEYFSREINTRFDSGFYPFKRAQQLTAEGQGLFWGMPKTGQPEESQLLFSEPVYASNVWMVVRKNSRIKYTTLADLQGLTLSTFYGVHYSPEFEQARGKVFQVEEEPDSINNRLRKLQLGRVDIVLLHSRALSAQDVLKRSVAIPELKELKILPKPLEKMAVRFVIGSRATLAGADWSQSLLPELNKAIAKGNRTGVLRKIIMETLDCP